MISRPQHCRGSSRVLLALVGLIAISTIRDNNTSNSLVVHSFSISPAAPFAAVGVQRARRRTTTTTAQHNSALYAGFTADAYLHSLSQFVETRPPSPSLSSTEQYLNSLSQLAASLDQEMITGSTSFSTIEQQHDLGSLSCRSSSTLYVSDASQEQAEAALEAAAASDSTSTAFVSNDVGSITSNNFDVLSLPAPEVIGAEDITTMTTTTTTTPNMVEGVKEWLDSLAQAKDASVAQMGHQLEQASAGLQAGTNQLVQGAKGVVDLETSKLVDGTSKAVEQVASSSLSDLAGNVLVGVETLGQLMVQILDAILNEFGSSVQDLVSTVQSTVSGVVNGAVNSVVTTVHNMGQVTMAEAAQMLVTLVVLVAKVLFSILNSLVRFASGGKGVSDYAMAAKGAVEQEATRLMAQATAAATDLSHKSLSELGSNVVDFSQDVGKLMVASVEKWSSSASAANQQLAETSSSAGDAAAAAIMASSSSVESVSATLSALAANAAIY